MSATLIQTDIFSLISVALGVGVAGAAVMWLFLRRSRKRSGNAGEGDKEMLYLVISRLGHRFKTAGEVILGHLHGFSDELPKDAERWRVARRAIDEEASEINALVERLGLVVRLGMAEQPLVIEPVNIPRLLEDIMVGLGPAADARGIVLGGIINKSSEQAHYISGDTMALREVFCNLLENAIKHNGPGTEITAEVKQQDNHLVVRIADTGRGICPEVLSLLFEKGKTSYQPRVIKGTGMGLYLCKILVELHGGSITAESEEGKRTEFRVILHLRRTKRVNAATNDFGK